MLSAFWCLLIYIIKMKFLQLPIEIRLQVYAELFGEDIAIVDGGRQDTGSEAETPTVLPRLNRSPQRQQRSAQLLRTCKLIMAEARPILYQNTLFRTSFQAFAGRLPVQMTNSNPSYPYARHLEWNLHCDILKRSEPAEVQIEANDVRQLQSVQLVCQAENWKGSLCGEWVDREVFVRGRQQVIDFARHLQSKMSNGIRPVTLAEDLRFLSRGRVVVRLFRGSRGVAPDVGAVNRQSQ